MSMSAIVCIECKTLPTKHTCKVHKTPICLQCWNNRGLTDLNLMLCDICQNMNENKSTKNDSPSIGNTMMSMKTNTQFPTPLPKDAVNPVTGGVSPPVTGTADDVTNPLELLKRVHEKKVPDAKDDKRTPTSIEFTNRTSPPVVVGYKRTPEHSTAQPINEKGKKTIVPIACKKKKETSTNIWRKEENDM